LSKKFADMESLGKLMRTAGSFMKILAEQESIVQRLSRFKLGGGSMLTPMLKRLGERERRLHSDLSKLRDDIAGAAENLPPLFGKFKKDALLFLLEMDNAGIRPAIKRAYINALDANGDTAYKHASVALEKLQRLIDGKINKNNTFSKMCRGEMSSGGQCGNGIPCDCLGTARQMLRSILRRSCGRGGGTGKGVGANAGGGDGDAEDGYSVAGSSLLDTTVLGPKRSASAEGASPRHTLSRSGKRGASGKGDSRGRLTSGDTENLKATSQKGVNTEGVQLDEVPWKYREAVKKYFGE